MRYTIQQQGESRSFPLGDPFLEGASAHTHGHTHGHAHGHAHGHGHGDVLILLGQNRGPLPSPSPHPTAILVELGQECLGVHTGESAGTEGNHVLGFARYRNGNDPPSSLIELVRQPRSDEAAIEAARDVFEAAGLEVSVCADQAGRIIDRLVRPKYNAALRFLDEGLATAEAMDLTCRLGLSYPDGPIERVERGGLADHHDLTRALFEIYGTPGFAPARRAVVSAERRDRDQD